MGAVKLDRDTGFPWPVIDLDREILTDAFRRCVKAGVRYGLGSKAPTLNSQPGADFRKIDCSGIVRWAIWQAGQEAIIDGSVRQHDWIRKSGFKRSTVADANRKDGVIRIAFLSPLAGGGVGHVALVLDGFTLESHSGVGPNRRLWGSCAWMSRTSVYVLDLEPG